MRKFAPLALAAGALVALSACSPSTTERVADDYDAAHKELTQFVEEYNEKATTLAESARTRVDKFVAEFNPAIAQGDIESLASLSSAEFANELLANPLHAAWKGIPDFVAQIEVESPALENLHLDPMITASDDIDYEVYFGTAGYVPTIDGSPYTEFISDRAPSPVLNVTVSGQNVSASCPDITYDPEADTLEFVGDSCSMLVETMTSNHYDESSLDYYGDVLVGDKKLSEIVSLSPDAPLLAGTYELKAASETVAQYVTPSLNSALEVEWTPTSKASDFMENAYDEYAQAWIKVPKDVDDCSAGPTVKISGSTVNLEGHPTCYMFTPQPWDPVETSYEILEKSPWSVKPDFSGSGDKVLLTATWNAPLDLPAVRFRNSTYTWEYTYSELVFEFSNKDMRVLSATSQQ
ncbi:hypothetical protein [Timonella senegalensis]|uniref:hypothetical protein n=1 Tax=Timonella senegalensis TaxID=1465825 RepID=UPI002FDD6514